MAAAVERVLDPETADVLGQLEFALAEVRALRAELAEMARWSLTTLREKLVKIGARLTRHARRLVLQMVEVAVPRDLFGQILSRIRLLSPVPT